MCVTMSVSVFDDNFNDATSNLAIYSYETSQDKLPSA